MQSTYSLLFVLLAATACNRESSPPPAGATPVASVLPVAAAPSVTGSAAPVSAVETVTLPDVFIADDAPTTLHVAWKIPHGTGVNEEAPFHVRWTTSIGLAEVPAEANGKGADARKGFDVTVAPLKGEAAAQLGGTVSVVVCDAETHKVCVPVKRKIEVTFGVTKGGKRTAFAEVALPAARPQGS